MKEAIESWPDRERQWRRKLGRIRIGLEPVEEQLERMRQVNLLLTYVCGGISAMFFALLTALGHPEIGFGVAAIIMIPVGISWLKFAGLRRRVQSYLAEKLQAEKSTEL